VFIVLYGVFDALIVNGFTAFGAKYFQQQFSLTPTMAGIVFGQSTSFAFVIQWLICLLLACLHIV